MELPKFIQGKQAFEIQGPSLKKELLRVGDNLLGRVIQLNKSGKVLIDFGKFRALARTHVPVAAGAVIDVTVLEKGPPIKLGLNHPVQETFQKAPKVPVSPEDPAAHAAFSWKRKPLPVGSKVMGKVILIQRHGKALIDFGKFSPKAETQNLQEKPSGASIMERLLFKPLFNRQSQGSHHRPNPIPVEKGDLIEVKVLIKGRPDRLGGRTPVPGFSQKAQKGEKPPELPPAPAGPSVRKIPLGSEETLRGRVILMSRRGKALVDFGKFSPRTETQGVPEKAFGALAADQPNRRQKSLPNRPSQMVHQAVYPIPVEKGDLIEAKILERRTLNPLEAHPSAQGFPQKTKKGLKPASFPSAPLLKNLQAEAAKVLQRSDSLFKGEALPPDIKEVLTRIVSHFRRIDPGKSRSELGSQLKLYIENSGLFFEKKIEQAILQSFEKPGRTVPKESREFFDIRDIVKTDVKPNLSVLKDFLDKNALTHKMFESRNLDVIRNVVERTFTEIAAQQGDAVLKQDRLESGPVLTYALPFEENCRKARLKVYYGRKNRARTTEGFKVSLLLGMDRLGQIRADFFLMRKDLSITFFVADGRIKKIMEEHSKVIAEPLRTHFRSLLVEVVVSETEIEEFDRTDSGAMDMGILDVRV